MSVTLSPLDSRALPIEAQAMPLPRLEITPRYENIFCHFALISHILQNDPDPDDTSGRDIYSTVTDFARFLGLSMSMPFKSAI